MRYVYPPECETKRAQKQYREGFVLGWRAGIRESVWDSAEQNWQLRGHADGYAAATAKTVATRSAVIEQPNPKILEENRQAMALAMAPAVIEPLIPETVEEKPNEKQSGDAETRPPLEQGG